MKKILLFIISFYKRFMSVSLVSLFGHSCRYQPTCSEYAYGAVEKYGVFRGSLLAVKRILRCNPFVRPGFDPVK